LFKPDIPNPWNEFKFLEDLVTVPDSSPLYKVWAYDNPKDQGGVKTFIGTINL
jgi:hypothetical protein